MSPQGSLVIKSGHAEEVPCRTTFHSNNELYTRLINFYRALDQPKELHPIWGHIVADQHKALHYAMMGSDANAVRSVLEHAYDENSAISGINTGVAAPFTGQLGWMNRFETAAVSIGVLPMLNPEQPVFVSMDIEPIIIFMERVTGCPITQHGRPGMRGVVVGNRFIHYSLWESICVWALLRNYVSTQSSAIMEIGGGDGSLCMWLNQCMSPSVYHLIDLPTMSVLQAYCMEAEGEAVWLRGEDRNDAVVKVHGLYPDDGAISEIDIAINQDSMPEMTHPEQDRYVELIGRSLKTGGVFFSHNHESSATYQRRVNTIMPGRKDFRQILRCPSWCRNGYVSEAWVKL